MPEFKMYPGDIVVSYDGPQVVRKEKEVKQDKYVQQVKEKFEQRSQTGIKKYNTTLERGDLSFLDWLTHLQEELMDATLYVERLRTSYAEEVTKESKADMGE